MIKGTSTLTFSRTDFGNYNSGYQNAIENKYSSFVFNGTLVNITRAEGLIKQFEPEFKDINVNFATIKLAL